MKKRILIVGAGFSGAVCARELAEAGHEVEIIDSRDHIGGNAYDEMNEKGIRVHKYGPHLFHTSNEKVVNWLKKFSTFHIYHHRVKAILSNGSKVVLPVNRETIKYVGRENIVETFIRPYSEKMWGMKLEEIDPSIMNRVPVREDDNIYYFPKDKFQLLPTHGYTHLFNMILDHKNIRISLETEFSKSFEKGYHLILNSMPIDVYYDFMYGELPYRSIKFHTIDLPLPCLTEHPVINFTHNLPYTRMTEWKNLPFHSVDSNPWTTITYEEPCDYRQNGNERFYPVKDVEGKNRSIYDKYAKIKNPKVKFIGRMGQYVYIDMDQAINAALILSNQILKGNE
jgi:UDP-galactopyranose mutase